MSAELIELLGNIPPGERIEFIQPAHAKLSASGSKRWLNCTPSVKVESQFPESKSGYAEEGSFAHDLAELRLRKAIGEISEKDFKKEERAHKKSPYYTEALSDAVDQYVTVILERLAEARSKYPGAILRIEQRLDFSRWVPEGFGTGDAIIITEDYIDVIDLKFGKGVPVSAIDNSQMRLYALGAVVAFELLYDFKKVRMTIVQPRLDSVSTEELTIDELLYWAEHVVRPQAAKAMAGDGEFVPGDHCQFCRAKAMCRARAEANLELAKLDFKTPDLLQDDEIAGVIQQADKLVKWATDIKDYALDRAVNHGKRWPGLKLVEGRSNRVYSDQKMVETVLLGAELPEEKIFKPKELFGITELTKQIGKKLFDSLVSPLLIKPPGKPVLVPESDERPEMQSANSAAEDFKDETVALQKMLVNDPVEGVKLISVDPKAVIDYLAE